MTKEIIACPAIENLCLYFKKELYLANTFTFNSILFKCTKFNSVRGGSSILDLYKSVLQCIMQTDSSDLS